ncbi:cbb3-type cytochrome c oxidase subunit 3 [Noviherbaspirillum cavernae]|uniref:Cbb3-type cytochrome c oxidase subunit 3 n=2 Tax=Noviherbaspirillum cavernae TaxID=2320862 RepID=A0A418WWB8_9BURK|nr:cbb3-type cytochrome c oxidase subunit 3 [Noviherbaspirillum cavernae]RJF97012.1 cbb3-type cytochrome c oxidase subunit 3 [Noviherbaspirillum cavernae]
MNFDNLIFDARSFVTVASFLSFLGIVWWAYSGRRKADFAEAANLPFADDDMDARNTEQGHG